MLTPGAGATPRTHRGPDPKVRVTWRTSGFQFYTWPTWNGKRFLYISLGYLLNCTCFAPIRKVQVLPLSPFFIYMQIKALHTSPNVILWKYVNNLPSCKSISSWYSKAHTNNIQLLRWGSHDPMPASFVTTCFGIRLNVSSFGNLDALVIGPNLKDLLSPSLASSLRACHTWMSHIHLT